MNFSRIPARVLPLMLVAAALASAAHAAPEKDLYSTEVKVSGQGEQAREQGLQKALEKVLVRVSGDPEIAFTSGGREVVSQARRLVQQFGYKRVAKPVDEPDAAANAGAQTQAPNQNEGEDKNDQTTDANAEPATELRLRVRFNGGAVNNALRDAGLPVWGSERPRTILWIARDKAGGASLILKEQAEPLKKVSAERGLPIVFPEQGAQERSRAGAEDVISGFSDRLRAVSRGYGASHLLIGKVENSAGLWQGQWNLSQGENVLDEWQNSAQSQDELLAEGMRRTADIYAQRYAVRSRQQGSQDRVVLAVDRVTSVKEYARVSKYLSELTAVDGFQPMFVSRDYVVFQVMLSGDAEVLQRSVGLADWLYEDDAARDLAGLHATGGTALGYRLGP